MARARKQRDDAARLRLGAAALDTRLTALLREAAGVRRGADPEPLHKMRVASRRLRAAATLFAPVWPRRWRPAWDRALRRLTRSLGRARDLDVQIAFLSSRLAAPGLAATERPGLERLRLRLEQRRERRQRRVVGALDRFATGTAPALRTFLTAVAGPADTPAPAPTAATFAFARAAVATRRESLLALADCVPLPDAAVRHHALRIAAKRLRYTLEIVAPLDPETLRPALRAAKQLQDLLGEMHDCDVWADLLPRFLARERRRTLAYCGRVESFAPLKPGLLALREERLRHRADLHPALVRLWDEQTRDGVWTGLADAPRPPREAAA
ncbi:MAG: CHAD domain-containing protein [Candidatus Krumholzibacteriia bacterium]